MHRIVFSYLNSGIKIKAANTIFWWEMAICKLHAGGNEVYNFTCSYDCMWVRAFGCEYECEINELWCNLASWPNQNTWHLVIFWTALMKFGHSDTK